MKTTMVLLFLIVLAGISPASSCSYTVVNLNDKNVFVTSYMSRGESFNMIINRINPLAIINGGFYCTKTLKPLGDIVVDGKMINDGYIGPAFVIFKNSRIAKIVSQYEYSKIDKKQLSIGIQTGPTLLKSGKICINLRKEGFRHVSGSAFRSAIGLTSENKLILLVTSRKITLNSLAHTMLSLGCVNALSLDGGGSSAIYYGGRVRHNTSRKIINAIVIKN